MVDSIVHGFQSVILAVMIAIEVTDSTGREFHFDEPEIRRFYKNETVQGIPRLYLKERQGKIRGVLAIDANKSKEVELVEMTLVGKKFSAKTDVSLIYPFYE